MDSKTFNEETTDFLTKLVKEDLENGEYHRPVATRFPPEPNGFLHIGSAYAIWINHSIAEKYGGVFHLRFDDTNPVKEDIKYVEAIKEDMEWLGIHPPVYFGSDYSERYYEAAMQLVRKGKAYVCDLTPVEITAYRGTLTEAGTDSPYRNRSVEENLVLFQGMREGKYPASSKVLRAKIDMSSPNMNLRDPVLYRILHAEHYRTRRAWCIYPMYDFAHPIQDFLEGITHSLCSAEFKDHRALYEWVLRELDVTEPPKQREFGRLNVSGLVTSKRYLRELVEGGFVDGWDDPRLPTIKALRRRGVTAEAIKRFVQEIGVFRQNSTVDSAMLDHYIRQDLKERAISAMAVLHPLKVILTNYPEDQTERLRLRNHETDESVGSRDVLFSRELYIEREDFMECPVSGFHRLAPGSEVRLKGAYFIKCEGVISDPVTGDITELHCSYDPETKSGSGFQGRKVKSTIHWVSAMNGVSAEVHLYDKLLREEARLAESDNDWKHILNPDSKTVITDAILEEGMKHADMKTTYQFIRHGYFCLDSRYATEEKPVYNRVVSLKDSWKKGK
ncbi:glutamine--tRNA ligase/YqeY domain fusion protein [Paenibacillus chibensis]|uniref:glutamine--tRNA ligase/YqeY domain fusion protein n=1 Tax=Paenibacillus chibensis TaxID=59846 RepID=UPI000FDBABDF|nr:glutamine--tRNA ligase/YqeY domain fusion protein [Paenibacillus chibensis]MEC0370222.1 glutamine--tRNA ligase/YqeY domain fusion protein [Paenibacillus chibensis]